MDYPRRRLILEVGCTYYTRTNIPVTITYIKNGIATGEYPLRDQRRTKTQNFWKADTGHMIMYGEGKFSLSKHKRQR